MSTKLKAGTASSGAVLDADTAGILELQTGSTPTTAVTIDASQNVGVGVTPFANSLSKGLDLVNGSGIFGYNNSSYYTSNAYYNSGWKYKATAGATAIFSESNGEISFYNAASGSAGNALTWSERMRIDASGNVLVGNTTTGTGLTSGAGLNINSGSTFFAIGHANGTPSGNGYVTFSYNGSLTGVIAQNGTTNVAYNTSSDYRLKENIAPMTGALNKVSQLKPVTYTWKIDGSDGQGFIAHELQEVVPDCVTGEKDAVNEDGSIKAQGIDTSFLVATLTAAIQEQQAMIEELKTKVAALEVK